MTNAQVPPVSPAPTAVKKSGFSIVITVVIVAVVLIAIIGAGIVGWSYYNRAAENARQAAELNPIIIAVNLHVEIQNRLHTEMTDKAAFVPAFKRAVNAFHDIDTSACPADFRVAYQRYLAKCDALVSELGTLLGVINSGPYIERMNDAWGEVEVSAVAHGGTFTHPQK